MKGKDGTDLFVGCSTHRRKKRRSPKIVCKSILSPESARSLSATVMSLLVFPPLRSTTFSIKTAARKDTWLTSSNRYQPCQQLQPKIAHLPVTNSRLEYPVPRECLPTPTIDLCASSNPLASAHSQEGQPLSTCCISSRRI